MRTSTDFISCGKNEGSIRLSLQEICSCIEIGASTADYDFLCSNDLVKTAIELRDKGTRVPDDIRDSAKMRSNPFAYIDEPSIFTNYDAIKLAALDATFNLTPSSDETSSKSFLFADICGGPGGFTEYLTWKIHQKNSTSRGYGITLRSSSNPQDHWHLENFSSDIPVNFTQIDGYDGTGDICIKNNILEFDAVISNNTKKRGVDLVVADGGFESLKKHQHLLLCEIITMLTCLRLGGNFVCKFFDIFDEWTADLLWLLYQLFDSICITKPLSSDPTLSERYIICKGFIYQHPTKLIDILLSINETIHQQQNDEELGRFIPRSLLEKDEDFMDYVRMKNMKFLLHQIDALEQLEVYIADSDRPCIYDQELIRKQCLQEWHLPI
ncbi:FtsJ-like methyltransferase-domain-containing protein [Cunninghamella echinulata]|nr:FtsJ-like methyltransferase-domain-containing protein [Cunninghamella echinulata]